MRHVLGTLDRLAEREARVGSGERAYGYAVAARMVRDALANDATPIITRTPVKGAYGTYTHRKHGGLS